MQRGWMVPIAFVVLVIGSVACTGETNSLRRPAGTVTPPAVTTDVMAATENPIDSGSTSLTGAASVSIPSGGVKTSTTPTITPNPTSTPAAGSFTLRATDMGPTTIRLEWTDSASQPVGFTVWFGGVSCSPIRCLQVASVGPTERSYTFTTAQSGAQVCFQVGADFRIARSEFTNVACVTLPGSVISPTATPNSTGSMPSTSGIAIGATVQITGTDTCLNARAGTSTSAQIIQCVPEGTVVQIGAGPKSGDGRVWWQLSPGGRVSGGWVAGDFLRLLYDNKDVIQAIYQYMQAKGWTSTGSGTCEDLPWPVAPAGTYCFSIESRQPIVVTVGIGQVYSESATMVTFRQEGGRWVVASECQSVLGGVGDTCGRNAR